MAYALLLFVPLSLALRYLFDAPAGWVFLTSAAAITLLADWIRRATEQLAERPGSTIGSLLNVSFGNTAELMLALFILRQANIRVVQAQITGSIIGTTLLFLGISALVGGIGRSRQTFNQASAGLLSTLLFLVVIAILLPAVFDLTERSPHPADCCQGLGDRRLHVSASVAPDAQIYADWAHITPSDRYPTEGHLRLPGDLSGHMPSAPRARSRSWS